MRTRDILASCLSVSSISLRLSSFFSVSRYLFMSPSISLRLPLSLSVSLCLPHSLPRCLILYPPSPLSAFPCPFLQYSKLIWIHICIHCSNKKIYRQISDKITYFYIHTPHTVAKTHSLPYPYKSFSAKEPYTRVDCLQKQPCTYRGAKTRKMSDRYRVFSAKEPYDYSPMIRAL